jgi:superfamily II DNA or RNA helicase
VNFTPLPHQPPMLDWLKSRDRSALFCSPGLGKTVVTLDTIAERIASGESRAALIISPLRVTTITWPTQIARWNLSKWMKIAHLRTAEGWKLWKRGDFDVALINPEQLPTIARRIKCRVCKNDPIECLDCEECDGGYVPSVSTGAVDKMFKGTRSSHVDTLVIDELSLAKDANSKRFRSLWPWLDRFQYRIGLTGTPVPNSYLDLWGQIRLLDDGERLGRSFHHYKRTYFQQTDYMGYQFGLRPGAKEKIDAKLADLALTMLGDDWLDVPTCESIDVEVKLPSAAVAQYKKMEKELLIELEKSDVVALNAATLAGKLLQITGGAVYDEFKGVYHVHDAKIEALKKLRKKHGKEPILVLCAYKHESARVLEAIPGSRVFDEKDLPAWQRGEIHTWVCDARSLSHGLDGLQQSCRIAVWMTLTYSNETYIQTNARIVRTGQSYETLIYRIIVPGSIDDAVAAALRDKSDTQTGLLNALRALQKIAA